jgi:hypothetical protein
MKSNFSPSHSLILAALLTVSASGLYTGCGTGSVQVTGSYGYSMGYFDDPWDWDDTFYPGPIIIGPPPRPHHPPHIQPRPMPRPPRRR